MGTEIKMPQLGETVVEGTITKWLKKEGDTISEDELLVEISTDKVDSEVPSTTSGIIQKILVPEGETVRVGTALAIIGGEGEEAPSGGGEAEQPAAEAPAGEAGAPPATLEAPTPEAAPPTQPEAPVRGTPAPPAPAAPAATAPAATGSPAEAPSSAEGDHSKRGIISPLVRKLADQHSVDLDQIQGTGTGGRIRKQDVLKFVEAKKSGAAPAATAPASEASGAPAQAAPPAPRGERGREEVVPWSNIRRRTAEHMVASHLETARAWNAVEADWTNIVKLRTAAKENFKAREGFNLTFMPFLAKAVCETLLEMPEINSTYDEARSANVLKHYVNLGIAVALEGGGLIVPVIHNADEKNLVGLARGINDVATRTRTKKLTPDDLAGGTFTITNPGPFGSIMSVPIIPKGQTAILAFEAIQKRVVVTEEDAIAVRSMGFLPMSWDHRAIDGAEAASFLAALRARIETTDFTSELSPYL
ncbi:MAG TPA: dihydrolipoamide acetyltransferase family protein [Actinomycetota bacterium]|nr:dihydrolipoamide acetyltransferase family protein [Actinomycetota bacterium]